MFRISSIYKSVLLSCVVLYIFVVSLNYMESEKSVLQVSLDKYFTNESLMLDTFTQNDTRRNKDVVILLWNKFFRNYEYSFGTEGKGFEGVRKCPVESCVITSDRNYRPIDEFDAIVFHGIFYRLNDIPAIRKPFQYYIYLCLESPVKFPLLDDFVDYFNWTITYRLDSDIIWPYFKMKNQLGEIVSPADNPKWESYKLLSVNTSSLPYLANKSKKVAWFVSNCRSRNEREKYVKRLQKYVDVDIYGKCGPFQCPWKNDTKCLELLRDEYYFYIAFENSHCTDYLSEKTYNALMFDTIPVVFGRVNFTKFIPPHSYLDGNNLNPKQLADVMESLIKKPDDYAKYFWWKPFYTFHPKTEADLHPFCELCKRLKQIDRPHKIYKSLKEWWNYEPSPYSSDKSKKRACILPNIE